MLIRLLKTIYSYVIFLFKYRGLVKRNKKIELGAGKEVFLLGSGPSMKGKDLSRLKNKNCIFLNNFMAHPSFKDISNPTNNALKYYIVAPIHPPQDEETWRKWLSQIETNVGEHIILIFGINSKKMNIYNLVKKYGLFKKHQVYYYFAGNYSPVPNERNISLLTNILASETVSLYAIYLALFLKFETINLLGMDHNYILYDKVSEMRMYESAVHQEKEQQNVFALENMTEEYLRQYKIFKKYMALEKMFRKRIFNMTDGGLLHIFERRKL